MKKKILIDLDVLTVAFWDKKEEAIEFLERAKKGEFVIYTPFAVLDTLSSWKYQKLKDSIKGFYEIYSTRIVSAEEYIEKSSILKKDGKKIADELAKSGIKEEDALLVVISAIFGLDAIVTYNRKHLHKNKEPINKILRRHGLSDVSILLPTEKYLKLFVIAAFALFLIAPVNAAGSTNVSILYGWNGTNFVPLLTNADGIHGGFA